MGCISSKHIISKSISFKAKLSQSFERIDCSDPVMVDRRKISGNDKLLAFLYTANLLTTNKVQDGVVRSDSNPITITAFEGDGEEIMSQQAAGAAAPPVLPILQTRVTEEFSVDGVMHSRSKSCHSFSEQQVKTDISEWSHKGVGRSRSFHTVEEFDALLEKIRLSREEHQITFKAENENSASTATQQQQEEEKPINVESKRKAIAKSLSPIITVQEIPTSTIEFLSAPSLRDWVRGADYYITPKFGSYALPIIPQEVKSHNNDEDDDIINPELVAAFEECMRQLEAEEENIIEQFTENQATMGMDLSQENCSLYS